MFACKNLAIMAYGNTTTIFHYQTEDKISEVSKPGYFNTQSLRVNDVVLVKAADEYGWFTVAKNKTGLIVFKRMNDKVEASSSEPQPAIEDLKFEELAKDFDVEAVNIRLFELNEKINSILATLRNSEIIAKA